MPALPHVEPGDDVPKQQSQTAIKVNSETLLNDDNNDSNQKANAAEPELKDNRTAEIEAEFKALDTNGDGLLEFHEMKEAIERQKGIKLTDNDLLHIKKMMTKFDDNKDGQISLDEFTKYKLSAQ